MINRLLRAVGWIVLVCTFLFWIKIEIASLDPCSVWAKNPQECNSSHYPDIE